MYTLEEIEENLLHSESVDLTVPFVAAAVQIDATGRAGHAGFVIHTSNNNYYLFHYTSEEVLMQDIPPCPWFFHKKLDFISNDEVNAFLAHCTFIKQNARPEYGCFYDGSFYDSEGNFFSENDFPEVMTCVGFCLNVIVGFIESDEYLQYNDWTDSNSLRNPEEYFETFINEFEELMNALPTPLPINIPQLRASLRRIRPDEYLAAAYLKNIPIPKSDIDSILGDVNSALVSKLQ